MKLLYRDLIGEALRTSTQYAPAIKTTDDTFKRREHLLDYITARLNELKGENFGIERVSIFAEIYELYLNLLEEYVMTLEDITAYAQVRRNVEGGYEKHWYAEKEDIDRIRKKENKWAYNLSNVKSGVVLYNKN